MARLTNAGIIGAAKQAVVSGARIAVTGIRIRSVAEIRQLHDGSTETDSTTRLTAASGTLVS